MSEYEYSTVTITCDNCHRSNTIVGSIPEFEIVHCSSCSKPMGQLRMLMAKTMCQSHGSDNAPETAAAS